MNDVKRQAPYCTDKPPPGRVADCGTAAGATIFFVTFVILNSYLLSNLFVAAILEIVASGLFNKNALVTPHDLEVFQVVARGKPGRHYLLATGRVVTGACWCRKFGRSSTPKGAASSDCTTFASSSRL